MKDINNTTTRPTQSPSPLKPRALLSTIPAVAAFFLLGYLLGLLSFAFSSYSPPSQFTNSNSNSNSTPKQQQNYTLKFAPPHDLFRFRTQCSAPIPQPQILPTILHHVYNDSSPYADEFPSDYTSSLLLPTNRRRRPRGWGSTNPVFRDLISAVRPLTIIEIGTFLGASALHMAALTRNLSSSSSLILCLDDFRGWPGFSARIGRDVPRQKHGDSLLLHQFMANVAAAGETDRVVPVPFSTASALAALCEWGVYGDLIEVDAGHDFHSAWADINMAWAVLRPRGVMFGHDYFTAKDDRGVRRAVNLFAEVKGLRVRANGEHWVLSPKPES